MKRLDFSFPGQMPGGQDRLNWLQEGWTEALEAVAAVGANQTANVATILYGMVSSTVGGTTTVTAGWFVYNGELIRFPGGSFSAASLLDMFVVITRTSLPLTYNSTAVNNVINDVTGVLTVLTSVSPTNSTQFKLDALVAWVVEDATVYSAIAFINSVIGNAWTAVGAPALTVSGGGTFGGGTVVYNSSKYINANCVAWNLQLTGYTVAGTVNSIKILLPGYVSSGGGGWANAGGIVTGSVHFGGSLYVVRGTLTNPGGVPALILTYESVPGPFPVSGNVNINISVIGEVE